MFITADRDEALSVESLGFVLMFLSTMSIHVQNARHTEKSIDILFLLAAFKAMIWGSFCFYFLCIV